MPYHKKTSMQQPETSSDGGDTTDVSIPRLKSAAYTGPLPLPLLTADTSFTDEEDDDVTPIAATFPRIRRVAVSTGSPTSSISEGNQADTEADNGLDDEDLGESGLWERGAFEPAGAKTFRSATVTINLSKTEDGQVQAKIEATNCEADVFQKIQKRMDDLCPKGVLSADLRNVHIDDAWGQATGLLEVECQEAVRPGSAGSYNFEFERDSNLDDETCKRLAYELSYTFVPSP